jgi:glutamate carboxypeptidase
MIWRRVATVWALVSVALAARAVEVESADLDPTERALVAAVERGVPASLALLERAVNVNSGTMNLEGVRRTAALFRPEFEALGFSVRWVDGADWGRAGHLLAERKGEPGALRILLIGHLDTVFEADSPFQRYRAEPDSTARGPGVSDMKGGDVVMLLVLRALKEAGVIDRYSVSVVLSGDEESTGTPFRLARRDLRGAAWDAEVAIGFEDGDGDPTTAVIARRGSSS